MQYFDKNGKEIRAGMKILMEDGRLTQEEIDQELRDQAQEQSMQNQTM